MASLMMDKSFEEHVLRIVSSVFDAYSAVLFQPDDHERCYRLGASFSLGDKVVKEAIVKPGEGLVGWIATNNQPLLVESMDQHRRRLGYYNGEDESDIKCFMGCPLPNGGALCADSKRPYSFAEKELKILQLFARLLTRQVVRPAEGEFMGGGHNYFEELCKVLDLPKQYKNWSQLLPLFLDYITNATGFRYGAFASLDRNGQTYAVEAETEPVFLEGGEPRTFDIYSGLAGWVLREGRLVKVSQNEGQTTQLFGSDDEGMPEFQSVICQPLDINKSTMGVFCLGNLDRTDIRQPMLSFLKQAVDQLALGLENLSLKHRLRGMLPKALRDGPA
jgi:transcriptional regulator with GAF, ATPase, and Fis domain